MRSALISAVIGLVIGLLLGIPRCRSVDSSLPSECSHKTTVTTEHTRDTLYIPRVVPYTTSKEVQVPVPYYVFVDSSEVQVVSKKKYADTTEVDSALYVTYDATVKGDLEALKLGVIDNRPNMIIKDSVTTTITKYPGGLYTTASLNTEYPSVGLMYLKNKAMFQAQYNFPVLSTTPRVTVGIGYRIK